MTKILIPLLLLLTTYQTHAQQSYNPQLKKCIYVAGLASEIQNIRQVEKHEYKQFKAQIEKIYENDAGRDVVLMVANNVYSFVGVDVTPKIVFDKYFNECVARVPPKEKDAI